MNIKVIQYLNQTHIIIKGLGKIIIQRSGGGRGEEENGGRGD
jgi:hypothetical protein